MKDYPDQLAEFAGHEPALAEAISPLRNLEGILRWAPEAGIPLAGVDLVQQDEYSYDLFLPLPDQRWLIFGVT
jgi:hypothetical protein